MNPREKETGEQRLFFIIQSTQFLPSVFFSTLISSFYPLGKNPNPSGHNLGMSINEYSINEKSFLMNNLLFACLWRGNPAWQKFY